MIQFNEQHLTQVAQHFKLGNVIKAPDRVYGGLLHVMWQLDTDKGSYALKQLSADINLNDESIIQNYELSEKIAARFLASNIPGICAIRQASRYLFILDGIGFLVYPWVDAKALPQDRVSTSHALIIASILAKIHQLDLFEPKISQPQSPTVSTQTMLELLDQAENYDYLFNNALRINRQNILTANSLYQAAIPILNSDTVITHGDLDQKNVLWTDNKPLLIDWESVSRVNPTFDVINTAFYWNGVSTDFNQMLFMDVIKNYQQAGGIMHKEHVDAAFAGTFGWVNWLMYNIKRSLYATELEQKNLSIMQVNQTLNTILYLQAITTKLSKIVKSYV